jgi:hypothetical protein
MIQRKQAPFMKTDQETVFSKEDSVSSRTWELKKY